MSQDARTITNRIILAGALALLGLASPERGTAQDGWDNLKGEAFGYLNLAAPIGDFRSHVDLGGGAGFGGVLFLGNNRLAGLRAEGSFIIYGAETAACPLQHHGPLRRR